MTQTQPLEILVVEDREENTRAAQEYFATRPDAKVTYAASYETALRLMNENNYVMCIFDRELPRNDGEEPVKVEFLDEESLGDVLAFEATMRGIPWAILTSGGHGTKDGSSAALIHYYCRHPEYTEESIFGWPTHTDMGYGYIELLGSNACETDFDRIPKSDPRAWKEVYTHLLETNDVAAKVRRFRYLGREISREE